MKLIDLFEDVQGRVMTGDAGQQSVLQHLTQIYGDRLRVISTAPRGSKAPDLLVAIDSEPVQIEVKTRVSPKNAIMEVFNSTLRRGDPSPREDMFVSAFEGTPVHTESAMDYYRNNDDPTVGFPCDAGTPPNGKFPKQWNTTDPATLTRVRKAVIKNFQGGGDNYFAIYDKKGTRIFWTGLGNNILDMPPVPVLTQAKVDTFGRQYKCAIRFAVKCAFE